MTEGRRVANPVLQISSVDNEVRHTCGWQIPLRFPFSDATVLLSTSSAKAEVTLDELNEQRQKDRTVNLPEGGTFH